MFADSPHLYRLRGRERDIPREVIEAALANSAIVETWGLASVLSLGHLAHQTGAPYNYLRSVVERARDPYRTFEIRRRQGRTPRLISSPDATLLYVQRWLLRRILSKVSPHASSYAYENGKSIRQCAQQHLGAKWLVKLDLHDFFHSIDERRVYQQFVTLGYGRLISFEMARICTRQATANGFPYSDRFRATCRPRAAIPEYSSQLVGFLPQGAPTSGALANLVARSLDERLSIIARDHQLVYTRYADDIVLSALFPFDRALACRVIRLARRAVEKSQFSLHDKKTHIVPPGARRIVLGLLVDGDRVRLSKNMRARIASHLYGVENFGLRDHQVARGFSSLLGMVRYIDGMLSFAHDIDPQWAAPWRACWAQALRRDAPMLGPYTIEDVFFQRQNLNEALFESLEPEESMVEVEAEKAGAKGGRGSPAPTPRSPQRTLERGEHQKAPHHPT